MAEKGATVLKHHPPLKIGTITIDPPVMLAPMAGYTDTAFRAICMRLGAGMCFTEVANAEALLRDSQPTFHMLEVSAREKPVAAHMYGCKPDVMAQAAAMIEKLGRFDSIDINCGCPVRKIVNKGCGAALMKKPEKIEAIVKAVRSVVSIPVTVKTRIGFTPEDNNMLEIAQAAEAGGATALTVHARYAINHHKGPADWAALATLKKHLRIPLIGNGGVNTPAAALAMIEQTGVDGVMIGRGAVGNPWIFEEIRCLFTGRTFISPSADQRREVIMEHLNNLIILKTGERRYKRKTLRPVEQTAVLHFRGHLYRYLHGLPGFSRIKRTFDTLDTIEAVQAAAGLLILES